MTKNSKPFNSDSVLASWQDNARPWTNAVRTKSIPSRALVTDQAIIDAICVHRPSNVLDLGCGEGWLSWHLATLGIHVLGVDAVAELVEAAKALSPTYDNADAQFIHMPYNKLNTIDSEQLYDLAVCNFSLLDKDDSAYLLQQLPNLLARNGHILIQTLHPDNIADASFQGWREENWQDIGEGFKGTAPWYYRSLAAWLSLFADSQLQVFNIIEPVHPQTMKPASIIFDLRKSA